MKRIIFTIIIVFLCFVKGNSQVTKNKYEEKIYGDFNGDRKFEYAFRVLVKKGHGNPVENGQPDVYEVHFSDKNIKPIKDNFYWFILINEGDLDKDGSDEFSVREDPMNGCIGSVKTFTIKNGKSYYMIEPFSFYSGSCNNDSGINPDDLVENDNGIVYYYDMPDDDLIDSGRFPVNSKGEKIYGKKIKAFEVKKPITEKTDSNNDALKNILNGTKSKKEESSTFFTGKKKFCDGLAWYYVVNIENDNIIFESYPDTKNEYHKNKTKPVEVIKGKIIGDIIKIPRPENCEDCGDEYETGRFKYKNGILYDANIEGGYNEYYDCTENEKKSTKSKSSKSNNDALSNILNGAKSNNHNNYHGQGTGKGIEGNPLGGRKTLIKPNPKYNCNEEGIVVVEIVVDKGGNVISAIAGVNGTTNNSKCLLDACKEAALNTKWEANENAPDKQVGKISYNFRLN